MNFNIFVKNDDGLSNAVKIECPNIHHMTVSDFINTSTKHLREMNSNNNIYSFYYLCETNRNIKIYITESDELFCKTYTNYFNIGVYFNFIEQN